MEIQQDYVDIKQKYVVPSSKKECTDCGSNDTKETKEVDKFPSSELKNESKDKDNDECKASDFKGRDIELEPKDDSADSNTEINEMEIHVDEFDMDQNLNETPHNTIIPEQVMELLKMTELVQKQVQAAAKEVSALKRINSKQAESLESIT